MDMLLTNKTAIVTGSGRGIGAAVALALAKEGASVVLADKDYESVKSMERKLADIGAKTLAVAMDITRMADIENMIKKTIDCFGKIDILVNNAGIAQEKPIEEVEEADWDKIIDVNLKGVFFCSQLVFKEMKKQAGGSIVNMGSMAGERGGRFSSAAYSASKAGVIVLTKCFALLAGDHNISVNAIAPGLIVTQMASDLNWINQEHKDIPLKRLGTPEDVAELVVFLASERSRYISGCTVDINGGMYMR